MYLNDISNLLQTNHALIRDLFSSLSPCLSPRLLCPGFFPRHSHMPVLVIRTPPHRSSVHTASERTERRSATKSMRRMPPSKRRSGKRKRPRSGKRTRSTLSAYVSSGLFMIAESLLILPWRFFLLSLFGFVWCPCRCLHPLWQGED